MTREELNTVRGYVSNIQAIKDAHNTDKLPINYGTICTITANGWKLIEELKALEQESQTFEWCTNCREYDQEKHCCHRWSKVIRNTVEEMKQSKTGHWISYWDEDARCYVYKCSECGNKQPFDTKHCWERGARMIELHESEVQDASSD